MLLSNAALRAHLSRNSRASIENKFHVDDSAAKMAEIYRELGA